MGGLCRRGPLVSMHQRPWILHPADILNQVFLAVDAPSRTIQQQPTSECPGGSCWITLHHERAGRCAAAAGGPVAKDARRQAVVAES